MTNKNKGKRKASENSSAEHVAFRQSNLALNPPSIYFDRPKKSTEKSDDEGNYKKSTSRLKPEMRTPKYRKENSFVWRLRHLARSVGEVAHRARGGHS
ncbi:hypothetical protein MHU86_11053 [Fragilaria crotonensis]|nr:hypothetical protein MHU86_11053 [Fragilaria crotonensis]